MRVQQIAGALTLSMALAAIGLIAVAAPASAGLGGGQTVRVESEITIRFAAAGHFYSGRVKANKVACTENRKVKLFFRRTRGGPRRLFKTTSTGDDGRWGPKRFEWLAGGGRLSADVFFAVVTRTERSGYVCLRDKSRVVAFHQGDGCHPTCQPSTSREAGIAAAPASAAEDAKEVKTHVHLHLRRTVPPGHWDLSGRVLSSVKTCERGRKVRVKRIGGATLDKDRTQAGGGHRGEFFLNFRDPSPPKHYRVKVRRSFPGEGSLKCEAVEKRVVRTAPIAAAPASAAEEVREVESRVTICCVNALGGGSFELQGEVQSSVKACKRGRRVTVIGGQRPVARARGWRKGGFYLRWNDRTPPEHYRVKVHRSFPPPGEGRSGLKCKADVKRFRRPH
jgi:hypothetical protein